MINLAELISEMREEGYEGANAEAKVCQSILVSSEVADAASFDA